MKVKLTIDLFSGRPNPTLELDAKAAKKVLDQIDLKTKFKNAGDGTVQEPSNLGYRGIVVEQLDKATSDLPSSFRITPSHAFSADGVAKANDNSFEKIIFDNLNKFKGVGRGKKDFSKLLEGEIEMFRNNWPPILQPIPPIQLFNPCKCAPTHELSWWNNNPSIKSSNNCYNYASNYRTDTFAQPGKAAALQYTSLSGCAVAAGQRSALDGAIADSLINTPAANNVCPGIGHLVALVIWPGVDFHWYRKGNDGKWSHKPGSTSATLLDNSGNPITDPRTANRGGYTQFCTFMQVIHGHIKIK